MMANHTPKDTKIEHEKVKMRSQFNGLPSVGVLPFKLFDPPNHQKLVNAESSVTSKTIMVDLI